MISPTTIQERCLKIWKTFLSHCIDNEPGTYFPYEISRIAKVKSKDILPRFSEYLMEIELLRAGSTEVTPLGYQIIWVEHSFQKVGTQRIPDQIFVPNLESYLFITGKERDFEIFRTNLELIKEKFPALVTWVAKDPTQLTREVDWNSILRVCNFFIANPKPNMYLRQLPIQVHTKFISDHEALFRSLLDFLIPDSINSEGKRFEERYNLLFDEALIRIRFLDPVISPIKEITYLTFNRSELKHYQPLCANIFIVENKMNFLTLPYLKNSISIWSGGGFSISLIQNIDWIKEKNIFYWGDIDEHGFEILNQFKIYFPKTNSILMEKNLLERFSEYITTGEVTKTPSLSELTPSERGVFEIVRANQIRLEQEKIPQDFVVNYLSSLSQIN